MIRQGRVAVNGKVRVDLPILIDPSQDKVVVDDEPIRLDSPRASKRFYFLLNKPKGVYTTNVAQGEQKLAIDLLPRLPARVYPVGQLESESKGLVLMTNDGELTNRLTHPRYGVAKTYRAIVDGFLKPETVAQLEKGVWLADPNTGGGFKTSLSHINVTKRLRDKSVLEITIREGRNRQVRRALAKFGHKVRELTRIRMGPLTLHGLDPGEFRELTAREVKELQSLGEQRPHRRGKRPRNDGEPPPME